MCDCYTRQCAGGCGQDVSIHIADFCVDRDSVTPYCPICTRRYLRHKTKTGAWPKVIDTLLAHVDTAHWDSSSQVWATGPGPKQGDALILCSERNAYGLYFN